MANGAGPTVAVGCILNRYAVGSGEERRALLAAAESAGLDHVAVGDHVSFFTGVGSDGLLGANAILSQSATLSTNTAVYLLALRHPVLVARQLADIAHVAPGRFVFGVGIGGEDRHEVEVCGVDPATRGARMDESLQIVRALLQGEEVTFEGRHFSLQEVRIRPTPKEPIPILVGGRSDAALSRAGRLGDGWFGIWVSAARYSQAVDAVSEAAANAGRRDGSLLHGLNVWCGVGEDEDQARSFVAPAMEKFYGLPYNRFARWSPAGTPRAVAEFLVPYVQAGCGLFNLILNGPSSEYEIEAAASIREQLLAAAA